MTGFRPGHLGRRHRRRGVEPRVGHARVVDQHVQAAARSVSCWAAATLASSVTSRATPNASAPAAVSFATASRPDADGVYPEGPGAEVHNLTQPCQLIVLGRTTVIPWPPLSRSRAVADLIRVATFL